MVIKQEGLGLIVDAQLDSLWRRRRCLGLAFISSTGGGPAQETGEQVEEP